MLMVKASLWDSEGGARKATCASTALPIARPDPVRQAPSQAATLGSPTFGAVPNAGARVVRRVTRVAFVRAGPVRPNLSAPMSQSLTPAQLDEILALQLSVAWAGESAG